ncbi:MAG: hypothetical protein EBY36_07820 [Gammaproteobacteria bacterium]|nr:hypothetical protein [Gammaproteobacteria bacterium]
MTLRNRLLVAAGACLLVVIAAFLGVQRRQQQVLFEQLDAQLAVVANSASSFAERSPLIGPPSFGNNGDLYLRNNGELYIGAVIDDAVLTIAAPASTPSLVPSLDELQRAPRDEAVTLRTSSDDIEMRVLLKDVERGTLIVGQSVQMIENALSNLWLSGFVAVAAIASFGLLVGVWVNRLSIRPIREAADVARDIASGRRDARVSLSAANPDAEVLGIAMNVMLDANAESEARLRSFVADASHELRTPLTTLIGYTDLHRRGMLTTDESIDDAMRRIHSEARRMSEIVDHLLLLASLDESTVTLNPVLVNVGQLLEDVAADARVVQPDRVITVVAQDEIEVLADPDRLLQAVFILVTNALIHTPISAALRLELVPDGDVVKIRVIDHGPGIGREHLSLENLVGNLGNPRTLTSECIDP